MEISQERIIRPCCATLTTIKTFIQKNRSRPIRLNMLENNLGEIFVFKLSDLSLCLII
ncbi:hypothetical protein LCGC14_2293470, partial [marine sediment metagenome]